MTVASEIARIQGVKANILDAIAAKGVTVPSGAKLADCPNLISSISGGGGISADNIVNIIPINKIAVVDANGYIGLDLTNLFNYHNDTYYNYAILSNDDYSTKGLGQVTFYTPADNRIGGRTYRTVIIGGREWLAENLDFKFSGLVVGQSKTSSSEPRGNYYINDEDTYGVNGKKYGLLYNWIAVKYLEDNKSSLFPGWHVPTPAEWDALVTAVGASFAGAKLKSTTDWSSGAGTDEYGFSVLPAGYYYYTSFGGIESDARFWTATGAASNSAYRRGFNTGVTINSDDGMKEFQYSVRLVKDTQ